MPLSFGEILSRMHSSSSCGFWTGSMKMLTKAPTATLTAAARPKPVPRWVQTRQTSVGSFHRSKQICCWPSKSHQNHQVRFHWFYIDCLNRWTVVRHVYILFIHLKIAVSSHLRVAQNVIEHGSEEALRDETTTASLISSRCSFRFYNDTGWRWFHL